MTKELPTKKISASGRRSPAPIPIPNKIQEPIRKRLKMVRQSRQIRRSNIKTLGGQTMRRNEEEDLSSMRMGDLYGLAAEYGMSLEEMVEYIVGKVDVNSNAEARRLHRMQMYMQSLSEAQQELACDVVQQLVHHRDAENEGRSLRNSREMLKEALVKQQEN